MEKIAKLSELKTPKLVTVKGKEVALFVVNGKVYCIDNTCPHAGGPLCEGELDNATITCPWHGWSFDVTTGSCVNPAYGAGINSHKIEVKGDDVFVDV